MDALLIAPADKPFWLEGNVSNSDRVRVDSGAVHLSRCHSAFLLEARVRLSDVNAFVTMFVARSFDHLEMNSYINRNI